MLLFKIVSIGLFIIALLVPIFVFYKLRTNFTGFTLYTYSIFISFFIMSSIAILRWYGYDLYIDYQISFLDYDGDGVWSSLEQSTWSDEENKYRDIYFNDGGRNVFALVIFPIFSLFYSIIIISLYWFIIRIKSK